MKRVFIIYYIITALVFVMLLTISAWKVYDTNEKEERIRDDYYFDCMDYFDDGYYFYYDRYLFGRLGCIASF